MSIKFVSVCVCLKFTSRQIAVCLAPLVIIMQQNSRYSWHQCHLHLKSLHIYYIGTKLEHIKVRWPQQHDFHVKFHHSVSLV